MRDDFNTFQERMDEDMNKIERKMDKKLSQFEEKVETNVAQLDRQLMEKVFFKNSSLNPKRRMAEEDKATMKTCSTLQTSMQKLGRESNDRECRETHRSGFFREWRQWRSQSALWWVGPVAAKET